MSGWQRTEIGGKQADVFDPPKAPRLGVIFLHGAGLETLADRPAFTRLLEELNLGCVCPHGKRSLWVDRVCPEFDGVKSAEEHVVKDIVSFFEERWSIRPRAIGIFGISMGGQGALRMAFRRPDLFPAAAGIASALDFHEAYGQGTPLDDMYESKEQCRQDTALMHIPPVHYPPYIYFAIDPADVKWHRGNDRLHEKLNALGVPHSCDLDTEAGGHTWDYFNRMAGPALRFVHEGLEKESRRLI
jgi:pimeloyl-ACP methyl ester carboxylesterase